MTSSKARPWLLPLICLLAGLLIGWWLIGWLLWPLPLLPQQASVPSVFSPQLWYVPAATRVNLPAGAARWLYRLSPQHRTPPPTVRTQLCRPRVAMRAASLARPITSAGSQCRVRVPSPS